MSKEQIRFLLQNSYIPLDHVHDLQIIMNDNKNESAGTLMILGFVYGIIIGKRQDRARRKGKGGVQS